MELIAPGASPDQQEAPFELKSARSRRNTQRVAERSEAVVVGAGPAGLAVSACLRLSRIEHVLLERESSVASSWRRHYDRLHLHTDRKRSNLPGAPFPRGTPRYPSRDQVIAYLERYAAEHAAPARLGEEVRAARREGEDWAVETARGSLRTRHLVIATGVNGEPIEPSWPGLDAFPGEVLHSSRYRNGASWRDRDVLVVGLGNSGGEIAIDLHEQGARPALSVRGPVCVIPRDILGMPILALAVPGFLGGAPPPGDREASAQRLHYCGFDVVPTGMLRQIAIEARAIARQVAADR